jgi:hypothetical protein
MQCSDQGADTRDEKWAGGLQESRALVILYQLLNLIKSLQCSSMQCSDQGADTRDEK